MYIYICLGTHDCMYTYSVYICTYDVLQGVSQTHGLRRWWTQQLGSRCHRVSVLKSDVATIARHGLTPTQCIGNCFFRNCMCMNKVMCQNYIYYLDQYVTINMINIYKYNEYIIDIYNGFYLFHINESVSRFSACLRAATTVARPTQRLRTWPLHLCVAKLNAPCGRLRLTSAHNCKISIVWISLKYYMHILSLYF